MYAGLTELQREVLRLVDRMPRQPNSIIPGGASDEEIDALGTRLGLPIPDELRAWLGCCNGPLVGPGGLFGIRPDWDFLDIEARASGFPWWREKRWIPVAGDGCGNYYVLDLRSKTRSGHPTLFLDWADSVENSLDTASYVVASGLWPFLRYILSCEINEGYDLWNQREALRHDSGLADIRDLPLPWEPRISEGTARER
jgi:hypothetical protein